MLLEDGALSLKKIIPYDAADAPGRNGRRGILFLRRRNWPIF